MLSTHALLHLFQLTSSLLPIGAYAYSQGLESAIECKYINDPSSAEEWIKGVMSFSLANTDLPLLKNIYVAIQNNQWSEVDYWNSYVYAVRETRELEQEERQLGKALYRLLVSLGVDHSSLLASIDSPGYLTCLAFAGGQWNIPLQELMQGFSYSWVENQIAAAIKLLPMGQTEGQRMLCRLMPVIEHSCSNAMENKESEPGLSLPSFAIASSLHEQQYSRLFRS